MTITNESTNGKATRVATDDVVTQLVSRILRLEDERAIDKLM